MIAALMKKNTENLSLHYRNYESVTKTSPNVTRQKMRKPLIYKGLNGGA